MTHIAELLSSDLAYLKSRPALPVMANVAIGFAVLVTKWSMRNRTRRHLRCLDPQILQDIGVTPEQARREATLPFWRP